jgi:predicted nucleic acid-binding protein
LIVFDASALVGAVLKADSVPERALLRAEEVDVIALSAAVDAEIAAVLSRPKFAGAIPLPRRQRLLEILRRTAVWFEPTVRVTDCRDPKDDKYLELALALSQPVLRPSSAATMICSCSTPGAVCASRVRRTISPLPDLVTPVRDG